MNCGYMSKYGVVAAISCETGEILDFQIMSKLCDKCKTYKSTHTKQEFQVWWVIHKCEINHADTLSSGLMEAYAAVIIFKRSEEKCKLLFTSMLGDGDTKMLAELNKAMPYGPGVVIEKEECVGHVAKRFYKCLGEMRDKRVPNDEGRIANSKGMTTESQITLCQYYKGAILSNTNDVDGMINDIQAIFHHCSSTDQNPQHSFCPKGDYTWCKFNKYSTKKTKNPNTDMPVPKHREKPTIPPFYAEYFKECFDKVCRRELLDRLDVNEELHKITMRASTTSSGEWLKRLNFAL